MEDDEYKTAQKSYDLSYTSQTNNVIAVLNNNIDTPMRDFENLQEMVSGEI